MTGHLDQEHLSPIALMCESDDNVSERLIAMSFHYSALQKCLHWLHAALLLCLIPLGLVMTRMGEGALTNQFYEGHKSLGILAFVVAVVRLAVRAIQGAPPYERALHPLVRVLAKAGHWALYGLVLMIPLVGYAATSICCKPVMLFGLMVVPLEFTGSESLMKLLFVWHETAAIGLALLVCGHIGMALYHRFKARDGVFERMT